jgi:hypothetical protein
VKERRGKIMKCKECKYEPKCNGLLHAQVRLGLTTCNQGSKARVVKKKPIKKGTTEPKKPKPTPAPMVKDVKDVTTPATKKVNDGTSTRSDYPVA